MIENSAKQNKVSSSFASLSKKIMFSYQQIEEKFLQEINKDDSLKTFFNNDNFYPVDKPFFKEKKWFRNTKSNDHNIDNNEGGGVMNIMRGNVFEKVGVNISTVYGSFSKQFRGKIPGTENNPSFFATGISLVAHMRSPLIPAMHFNTRYIVTDKEWFGGGGDITPSMNNINEDEINIFHDFLKESCEQYKKGSYSEFKESCDNYFFLKHRNESRGAGGIFCDYIYNKNKEDFYHNFSFIQDMGNKILQFWPIIVEKNMLKTWTKHQKELQLKKRGRYVEFNLLHDRGTKFGLETGGNIEAILMSLPPTAKW
ncbi:MAG TPA: oxygen-dependent coproporphyrinogen oxidase [Candidatus Megaira endosymbiont of Hartmannula sinica]|nr:oxygen-dependent coproporphyrinogen oxidase [Candidatus Megaera endosymbiont of Hartmannula sinica]